VRLDDFLRLDIGLARGALACANRRHEQVIAELERQPEERVKLKAGELAGKIGVMLLLSDLQMGHPEKAEAMRHWLLSEQCPLDAGNGLAKEWVACLPPM
jgi:hypothetical protein